jgi:hypothetical protein
MGECSGLIKLIVVSIPALSRSFSAQSMTIDFYPRILNGQRINVVQMVGNAISADHVPSEELAKRVCITKKDVCDQFVRVRFCLLIG